MRIVLLQEERYVPAFHGSSKCSRALLEGLALEGHDCLALCPIRLATETSAEFQGAMSRRNIAVSEESPGMYRFRYRGVDVAGLPAGTPEERREFIRERLRACRPDVVIVSADPRYYLLESALLAEPERTVFIVHSHEHVPFGPLSGRLETRQWELMRRARSVIAVSRYSQEYLREHGGLEAVVCAFPIYGPGPFPNLANAKSGAITLVGGHNRKGIPVFLELARAFPQYPFAILPWRADTNTLAPLKGIPNIRILDPSDDIEDILRQTKILLAPSIFPETFGLIVVEAMLRGIPALASDLGGLREAKLGTDYLIPMQRYPSQDLTPWCAALERLWNDPAEYARVSFQSRKAAAGFVCGLSVRTLEDLLRTVAGPQDACPVAVVDPYDAGFALALELSRRGHPCVGVESGGPIDESILAKCDRRRFSSVIRHGSSMEETTAALKRLNVTTVLPGCETGVALFDHLSEAMQFCSNGTALSEARRNKYAMHECARSAGIPVAAQCCSRDWEEIRDWARRLGTWPVILKPPHSLGSEDVHLCRNESELGAAFERVLGRRNLTGLVNHVALVQELLEGTQYVLDTVSRDGRHFLGGVWQYGRPEFAEDLLAVARGAPWPKAVAQFSWDDVNYAAVGSNSKQIRPGNDRLAESLLEYATGVLDAIGIRHGPAHFELMDTPQGIRLMEVGARLHGAPSTHWMSRICIGRSQLDQTIEAYLDPRRFLREATLTYVLGWHGFNFRLHPYRRGWLSGFRGLDRIEALPSFRSFFYMAGPKQLQPLDCVGVAALIHPDEEVVLEDCRRIREMEKDDLFEIDETVHAEARA